MVEAGMAGEAWFQVAFGAAKGYLKIYSTACG